MSWTHENVFLHDLASILHCNDEPDGEMTFRTFTECKKSLLAGMREERNLYNQAIAQIVTGRKPIAAEVDGKVKGE